MRYLFVVLPLAGHVNPAGAVARTLARRGHEVAWAAPAAPLKRLLGDGDATVFNTRMRPYRGQRDRGARALKSLWEEFVLPYARFTLPAVERAALAYRPDVVVVDQHALAGALAARRHGLRWATLAPQPMDLTGALRTLPKVDDWITAKLDTLCAEAGVSTVDPRFSPHLVLAFTTAALTGPVAFPDHFALVGPVLGRPSNPGFPWAKLDPGRRKVLVTMGTLADDVARDFYPRVMEAVLPLGDQLQVIVTAPPGAVPDPPANVLVVREAPMLELMPQLSAVLCHGGMGSVNEALAEGVPLVVAPIKHDQPLVAAQVVDAGAGLRVRFGRVRAEQLRAALLAVLDDPAYRAGAARVRDSFAAAGGADAAASHLEALASRDQACERSEPPSTVVV